MSRFHLLIPALGLLAAPCVAAEKTDLDTRPHVDVVFAIDCSGSMGGVINTAKQKVWGIVNEIAKAKPSPVLRIGLLGYGDEARTYRKFPLSDDLDQVYADLTTFKDEGWSEEYVGLAIEKAVREMDWKDWEKSGASNVLRVLYVVGNETAEQGPLSYKKSAPVALGKQIYVNAIYCGEGSGPVRVMNVAPANAANAPAQNANAPAQNSQLTQNQRAIAATMAVPGFALKSATKPAPAKPAPAATSGRLAYTPVPSVAALSPEITTWLEMAQLGGGEFSQIAAEGGGVTIATPYDKDLAALNTKINGTYLAYGERGVELAQRQVAQDANSAAAGGTANLAARAQAKGNVQYNNRQWDLVDASKEKNFDLAKLPKEQLPSTLQKLSPDDQKKYVAAKSTERGALQKQIGDLSRKREEFIAAELKKSNKSLDQALDEQILRSIRSQAMRRGFRF